MNRQSTLWLAASVIVAANAVALLHAALNRSGEPEAELTLTERELIYSNYSLTGQDQDTGVSFVVRIENAIFATSYTPEPEREWLDSSQLRSMGFDLSMPAGDDHAAEFYSRQRPRPAYVAVEMNGPAADRLLEKRQREEEQSRNKWPNYSPQNLSALSRLAAIDGDRDPAALRSRHSDRHAIAILPALVYVQFLPKTDDRAARVTGRIDRATKPVHISQPLAQGFLDRVKDSRVHFTAHVKFGKSLEPWVSDVQFQ